MVKDSDLIKFTKEYKAESPQFQLSKIFYKNPWLKSQKLLYLTNAFQRG